MDDVVIVVVVERQVISVLALCHMGTCFHVPQGLFRRPYGHMTLTCGLRFALSRPALSGEPSLVAFRIRYAGSC